MVRIDKSGDTALSWAEEWENWGCVSLLRYCIDFFKITFSLISTGSQFATLSKVPKTYFDPRGTF